MKEYLKNLIDTKNLFVAPAVLVGLCIIIFALIIKTGVTTVANKDQSISVTGTAEKFVTSDTAKWTISVSERAFGEGAGLAASRLAQNSANAIKNYLIKSGVQEKDITIQTSNLSPICEISSQGYENCSIGVRGQTANQSIIVNSENVSQIQNISSRIATEFSGANISSNTVEYFYTKLKDDRIELLSQATKNAKERADSVANAGGATIGNITSLSSGVFQVTQKNSVSVDDYGMYDTTSIDKKITATVKANFSVR